MLSQWLMQTTSADGSNNQYVYKLTRSLEELLMIDAALKCLCFKHKGNILESGLEKIWCMLITVCFV